MANFPSAPVTAVSTAEWGRGSSRMTRRKSMRTWAGRARTARTTAPSMGRPASSTTMPGTSKPGVA